MHLRFLALSCLASVLSLAPASARAAQGYDNCTGFIDSVPVVISTQGTWCLRKDLSTAISSGNVISINASNVTLDCNDFKLGGLAAGLGTSAIGIQAEERDNITVRNCHVRGFMYGIYLSSPFGNGHFVERNRLSGNTNTGIIVDSDGGTIQSNQVLDTGGTPWTPSAAGIAASGSVDILDNLISGVTNRHATGIEHAKPYGQSSSIRGNRVRGLAGSSTNTGILMNHGDTPVISRNELHGPGVGNGKAIACYALATAAVYRDNTISGFPGGISSYCVDGGGNIALGIP